MAIKVTTKQLKQLYDDFKSVATNLRELNVKVIDAANAGLTVAETYAYRNAISYTLDNLVIAATDLNANLAAIDWAKEQEGDLTYDIAGDYITLRNATQNMLDVIDANIAPVALLTTAETTTLINLATTVVAATE